MAKTPEPTRVDPDGPAGTDLRARRFQMGLLFVALFNSILGLSILFPVIAPLGRELGLDERAIGALMTGYALMQLVTSSYWGRQSERRGRTPILLRGILGFAVTFGGFGLVAELGLAGAIDAAWIFPALMAMRLLGGAFSSATMPTAQAYVADVTSREERTRGMALIGAAFGLGIIVGPGIGAVMAQVHLVAPVWLSVGIALLNALFVATRLPEPTRRAPPAGETPSVPGGRVRALLAISTLVSVAAVSMEQTVAFAFQDRLSLDATHTARTMGMALVIYGVVAVAAQGGIARRKGISSRSLVAVGLPLAGIGLGIIAGASTFWTLTAGMALQALGQGLVLPGLTATLSLSVDATRQGTVAGLHSSAQALGRVVGPALGTILYAHWPPATYATGAGLVALALLLALATGALRRPDDRAAAG